jgi:hypothetical protein
MQAVLLHSECAPMRTGSLQCQTHDAGAKRTWLIWGLAFVLVQLKINTDESPGVASKYNIRSIPTVMIFKTGQKMDAVIGAVPKSSLVQVIEKYL